MERRPIGRFRDFVGEMSARRNVAPILVVALMSLGGCVGWETGCGGYPDPSQDQLPALQDATIQATCGFVQ